VREYRYPPYRPKRRKVAAKSLEALIHAYRRSPEWDGLSERTRTNYAIYLRPLEEVGHLAVRQMKHRELLLIRDAIACARGNGAATGFMRAASAVFGWAVDHDWIEYTPVHRIKRLPGGHLRAWTRADADAAVEGLPEHLRRVVLLARFTGQRRGDRCATMWSAYDGTTLRLVRQKTGAASVIPCHPVLKSALDGWRRDATAVTILTNTFCRPWVAQHLSHELPKALTKLSLAHDLNVHGLRKLAAADLADVGCTMHEIAANTGHRTLAMVQEYTRSAGQERVAGAAVVNLIEFTKIEKR